MNPKVETFEVTLPKEVYDVLVEVCVIRGLDISGLIERIIADSLEQTSS